MKNWLKPLLILFILPVVASAFFFFAPQYLEKNTHALIAKSIEKDTTIDAARKAEESKYYDSINYGALCLATDSEAQNAVKQMQIESLCTDFKFMNYSLWLAGTLILMGLLQLLVILLFAQMAKGSRTKLISAFKSGWVFTKISCLFVLFGQTVLAISVFFYATVLISNSYFPKLLFLIAAGGAYAFYNVVKLMFTSVPLEVTEPAAESVSESTAPTLWKKVRALAEKLGTTPPDTILLGISDMFFVTEISVNHSSGVAHGRTLYLSAPLMKRMSEDEISAIIGHELGHFKGDDTRMTREFYPYHMKTGRTIMTLADSGIIAQPAAYLVAFFDFLFYPVISTDGRDREFEADRAGSLVSSSNAMARALVKAHWLGTTMDRAIERAIAAGRPLNETQAMIEKELASDDEIWKELISKSTAHPVDSHPPLRLRLEALKESADNVREFALRPLDSSAYDLWVNVDSVKLQKAEAEHAELLEAASHRHKVLTATEETTEGRDILEKVYKPVEWSSSTFGVLWPVIGFMFLVIIFSFVLFIVTDKNIIGILSGGALFIAGTYLAWRTWKNGTGSTLTVNSDGLYLNKWTAPIRFADIKEMNSMSNNGIYTLTLTFNEKRPSPYKNAWIKRPRLKANIIISYLKGKPDEIVSTIYKYYLRQ